jgi:hypothetical protein
VTDQNAVIRGLLDLLRLARAHGPQDHESQ